MDDADAGFGDDGELKALQVVVVLVDRPGYSVFDGDYSAVDLAVLEALEDVFESLTGEDLRPLTQQLSHSLLAEGSFFTLKRGCVRRLSSNHSPCGRCGSQRRAVGIGYSQQI